MAKKIPPVTIALITNDTSKPQNLSLMYANIDTLDRRYYNQNEIDELIENIDTTASSGSVQIESLQIEGDNISSLSGSYTWLNNVVSGLSDPHNITVGDIVKLTYEEPAQLWVNVELTYSDPYDYLLIPITGNTTDRIVEGQQLTITGGVANGATYEISSVIMLDGAGIPDYHLASIAYVSGPVVTIPTYPSVDTPSSVDDPSGPTTESIEAQTTDISALTIDITESKSTSVTVSDIEIYSHHFIKTGNFAIGKEVAEYPLDVEGKGKIESCITESILTEFPSNSDESFDDGDLVFFGNDSTSNIKLSSEYMKTYDENSAGFGDLADDTILKAITVYGDEICVTVADNGGLELQAFRIDDNGTTLGTALSLGVSATSEIHLVPLNYTKGDNFDPDTASNSFCVIELNTSTNTLWRGYYQVDSDLNITAITTYSDSTVSIQVDKTIEQVVPIKSRVNNASPSDGMRYYVLVYNDNNLIKSYASFISININTEEEKIGVLFELPVMLDASNQKVFAHFRMSDVDLHLIYGNTAGIVHLRRQLLSSDYSVIAETDVNHGIARNTLLFVDFKDNYISGDNFDYRCVQISKEATFNISENTWSNTLLSSVNFALKENCAYQHGTDYDHIIPFGNSQKIIAFNRTSSAVTIIDLKDKTIVPTFNIGAFPYSGSRKEIAFKDRFIAATSNTDYGMAKFFFNHFGIYSSETSSNSAIIMRGLVTYPTYTFKEGTTYSLGSKITQPSGATTITLSDKNHTGIILGTALSTTQLYFNPTLNSITGHEDPLNEYFDTVSSMTAVSGSEGKLAFCRENNTFYKYKEATGPGVPLDVPFVVQGGGGFDTRWIAVAGQYIYDEKIRTLSAYNGLAAAGIDKDKIVTFSMPSPLNSNEDIVGVATYAGFGKPLGIVFNDIANESTGRIVTYGPFQLDNFDTTPASVGDPIYINSSGDPVRTSTSWILGYLLKPDDTQSIIFIDITSA